MQVWGRGRLPCWNQTAVTTLMTTTVESEKRVVSEVGVRKRRRYLDIDKLNGEQDRQVDMPTRRWCHVLRNALISFWEAGRNL